MVFNCVFQTVFKIPHRLQWFSNDVFQSVFRSPHWFQWFSNNMFQSVFKIPPQVSKCFQIMCFKVFSKFPIDFKVFSKSPIGFNGFQLCVSKCFQNSP